MGDYRKMYDNDWIKVWDLDGQEITVTILAVTQGTLKNAQQKATKKPVLTFKGWPKPLAICKTDGATIAGMYGKNTDNWRGKRITLYPTTTSMAGQVVDCIRVRPVQPKGQGQPMPTRKDEPEQAQGEAAAEQPAAEPGAGG